MKDKHRICDVFFFYCVLDILYIFVIVNDFVSFVNVPACLFAHVHMCDNQEMASAGRVRISSAAACVHFVLIPVGKGMNPRPPSSVPSLDILTNYLVAVMPHMIGVEGKTPPP